MAVEDKHYPNITWAQFAVCNDDVTTNFESLTRRLFQREFVEKDTILHSDSNHPGVEIIPVIEKKRDDYVKRRKISFQSKYFENRVGYSQIRESSKKAIEYYEGKLDVIYLFCNQTINTSSKAFKSIEKILQDAGIEIYPISNTELLDMVARHKDIANYFFLKRKGPDDLTISEIYAGIVVHDGGEVSFNQDNIKTNKKIDLRLLESLVLEKIETCKAYIAEMNFTKLKVELQNIFIYNLEGVKGSETLYFYKALDDLHDGKSVEEYMENFSDNIKSDVEWVQNYLKNPEPIKAYSLGKYCIEIQLLVIDKMFSVQLWASVYSLCKEILSDESLEVTDTIRLYYGLTAFNLQKYDESFYILNDLYQKKHTEQYLIYVSFAEIKKINVQWRLEGIENAERLVELINILDSLKETEQYIANEVMVELLRLETAYNIGLNDKEYLENAIVEYEKQQDSVKNDNSVKFFYGLCLELNGNMDMAVNIYETLNWEIEESVAIRYMICKIFTGSYEEAIAVFENTIEDIRSVKLNSLYFTALYHVNREIYEQKIVDYIKFCENNIQDLISIASGIEDINLIKDNIFPKWKVMINRRSIDNLSLPEKTELIYILVKGHALNELQLVLNYIDNMSKINRSVLINIYKFLFDVCNNYKKNLIRINQLDSVEEIADRFLKQNILRKGFLQIKYLCARIKEKKFSMLKYAKELFDVSHEESVACNIINMLFERNETDQNVYMPYIDILRKSEEPLHCMTLALAMIRLGKTAEADLYAYKALYCLDGEDDFNIYKMYLGFYSHNLSHYHLDEDIKSVAPNTVVTLKENLITGIENAKTIEICLDSESEFGDGDNCSLDIRHVNRKMPLSIKLIGSGLNQILKIDGVSYKIIQIKNRMNEAAAFVFNKINEYPEKFEGVVHMISSEDPEDMINQIKELTDRSEYMNNLLDLYHFKENNIGLPIDSFVNGNYDEYIDALNFLLYGKDQAMYTGYPIYKKEGASCYVPSLSTLVLLSSMNLLNILDKIKSLLIIPDSYNLFFQERYSSTKRRENVSEGKLVTIGGKITIIPYDVTYVEIWERIIDFCAECRQYNINDDDRIGYTIGGDLNGEELVSSIGLHRIHLDALILCEKEKATFLCDDLFFRKIADKAKISNVNVAAILLQYYVDKEFIAQIVMEFSKTNYLYIPLIARTDEEASELIKNLLNGKLKQRYNEEFLKLYREAFQKTLQELFGVVFEDN